MSGSNCTTRWNSTPNANVTSPWSINRPGVAGHADAGSPRPGADPQFNATEAPDRLGGGAARHRRPDHAADLDRPNPPPIPLTAIPENNNVLGLPLNIRREQTTDADFAPGAGSVQKPLSAINTVWPAVTSPNPPRRLGPQSYLIVTPTGSVPETTVHGTIAHTVNLGDLPRRAWLPDRRDADPADCLNMQYHVHLSSDPNATPMTLNPAVDNDHFADRSARRSCFSGWRIPTSPIIRV